VIGLLGRSATNRNLWALRAGQSLALVIRPPESEPTIARVLAGRELAQSLLTWARPTPATLRWGAAVDLLHATSMLPVAWLWPQRRALALSSAAQATGWALTALRTANRLSDAG
jgi:hypothetical protein